MKKLLANRHKEACRLLGVDPNKVKLVSRTDFKAITGYDRGNNYEGRLNLEHQVYSVRNKARYSTFLHEILHFLFPSKPHWWIYAVSRKLAGARGYIAYYGYGGSSCCTADDYERVPSKPTLIKLAKEAAIKKGVAV